MAPALAAGASVSIGCFVPCVGLTVHATSGRRGWLWLDASPDSRSGKKRGWDRAIAPAGRRAVGHCPHAPRWRSVRAAVLAWPCPWRCYAASVSWSSRSSSSRLDSLRWAARSTVVWSLPSSTNESRWSAARRGESIGLREPHAAVRSACSPPGSASRSLRAIRSLPSALVRVRRRGRARSRRSSARPAAGPRRGPGSLSARWTRRRRSRRSAWVMVAGVADGLLAVGVGSSRRRRRSFRGSGWRSDGRRSPSARAAVRRSASVARVAGRARRPVQVIADSARRRAARGGSR
jgi:hypothetical protein